jgi:hypothetical protein
MCSGPSGTKEKMKRLLIAFLYFSALTTLMVGCTTITGQNATQKLKNRNCEIAANAAELYQVSIDHWVDFEMEQGLGRLMRSSFFWKRKSGKISDPARRQRAEGALSALIENTAVQYVNALTMLHELRAGMEERDRLFYIRKEGEVYGRLYITRSGKVLKVLPDITLLNDLGREMLWREVAGTNSPAR